MRILLTGCTGFVGKFTLRELILRTEPGDLIICLLRGKKGKTVQERWSEIQLDSLFYGIDFNKTQVVEGDLNKLDSITWDEEPDVIVHAAANVKTIDTYPNLYRDNVIGVQKLCDMCVKWNIRRLHLISTCYVHPRNTTGKPELLAEELPQSLFTTDYTYTKYLGERIANSYSNKFHISILRLSCVSAPSNWLDAHPTPMAMAHLGFVSLALRGKIDVLRIPSTMSLSIIPVNVVARSIVDDVLSNLPEERVQVKQICASPSSQWNISIPQLCSAMKRLSRDTERIDILNMGESEFKTHLIKHWGYNAYLPWGYKSLIFHQELNDFMNKFADGQKFISNVPDEYFPSMPDEQICDQICVYVARGNHQYQLEKGMRKSRLDSFWGSMPEHYIQTQVMFKKPLVFNSNEEAERRMYDCFSSYRPFFVDPYSNNMIYDGKQGPRVKWSFTGKRKSGDIELLGDYKNVKGFKITAHHGIGDGIAFLGILPRIDTMDQDEPVNTMTQSNVKPRSLNFTQEIQCLVYYLAALIKIISEKRAPVKTVEKTIEMSRCSFNKIDGKSFTSSLVNKSYPILSSILERDTIVYAIPASVLGAKDRGLQIPKNSFVPILLPWSSKGGLIQEWCLNSKAVKFMGWLVCNLIAYTDNEWLRDIFMDKVDVVFSSLMASDRPLKNVDSVHFLAPTSTTIAFTIDAMSVGTETFLTVASCHHKINAKEITKELISK